MTCPHCKNELEIPPRTYRAIETYQRSYNVVSECCGKMVQVSGTMRFSAWKGDETRKDDDWGISVK